MADKMAKAKWSETKDATEYIQKISDQVKTQVEENTKEKYDEFKAVKYRESIKPGCGAGVEYLIKVHVGGSDYDHVCVSQHPCVAGVELLGVMQHQPKDRPLVPFLNEQQLLARVRY